jgi:hypothetical protein
LAAHDRCEHSSRDDHFEGIVCERKLVAENALVQRAVDVTLFGPSQHRF